MRAPRPESRQALRELGLPAVRACVKGRGGLLAKGAMCGVVHCTSCSNFGMQHTVC